jgi:hypothetical protein
MAVTDTIGTAVVKLERVTELALQLGNTSRKLKTSACLHAFQVHYIGRSRNCKKCINHFHQQIEEETQRMKMS